MSGPRRGPPRVAVLYGAVAADAAPDEQDVLVEVDTVQRALVALGCAPITVPLTLDLESARRALLHIRPAFVFNLVESVEGLGRLIHLAPALLDSLVLPYTGAGNEATFLTSRKPTAKRLLAAAGIATPAWVEAGPNGLPAPDFAGPYIVKSVWEHASIGIEEDSVVGDPRRVAAVAKRRARRFGGEWFAEAFIEGREFNLSLLGRSGGVELLPPAEMLFVDYPEGKRRIVDYAAKWHRGSFEFTNTVRRFEFADDDRPLLGRLEAIATDCWRLFGLRGHARVDVRVDAEGRPWVLEVNINPCLSPNAGFAAAAERAGLSLTDVVRRIAADMPGRNAPATAMAERFAARVSARDRVPQALV
jgi:D-alanine-D-alanine ligase